MSTLQYLTYKDVSRFSFSGLKSRAKVVRIVDGDTAHILLEYHDRVIHLLVRLNGIDTPEKNLTPTIAQRARNRLAQLSTSCQVDVDYDYERKHFNTLIDNNTKLVNVECFGADKYGRELVVLTDPDTGTCINETLVREGFAHSYDGGKKQTWTE